VRGAVEIASGRLYLNAPKAAGATSSGVEDEIAGFAVAIGRGGGESEGNGFVEECDFDQFSIAFGVTDGACRVPGVCPIKRWRTSRVRPGSPFCCDVV
jgi:hypothetical protein